jgi:hypothetical protein
MVKSLATRMNLDAIDRYELLRAAQRHGETLSAAAGLREEISSLSRQLPASTIEVLERLGDPGLRG